MKVDQPKRRKITQAAIFLLAATSAFCAPVYAQDNNAPAIDRPLKSLSDEELLCVGEQAEKRWASNNGDAAENCTKLLSVMDEALARKAAPTSDPISRNMFAFDCAQTKGDFKSAYAILPSFEKFIGALGWQGVWTAINAGADEDGVQRFERMAQAPNIKFSGNPSIDRDRDIKNLDTPQFWEVTRTLTQRNRSDLRERMIVAAATSPHFDEFSSTLRVGLASKLIEADVAAGRTARVATYLPQITSQSSYVEWLGDRRYAMLWPQFEARVGPEMRILLEANARHQEERYAKDKTDREAFKDAVSALYFAGRFEDAIRLARTYDHSPSGYLAMTQNDGWALNVETNALDVLGRPDEADALYDAIVEDGGAGPDAHYWMINFAVNRAARLIHRKQGAKAYEAAVTAEKFPGSTYAEAAIDSVKICALVELNRRAEITPLLASVEAKRKDNYGAAVAGFLCAGNADKAAALYIEGLNDPNTRAGLLARLQRPEFELFYNPAEADQDWQAFQQRADIVAAFAKYGRAIPDTYIPMSSVRANALYSAVNKKSVN